MDGHGILHWVCGIGDVYPLNFQTCRPQGEIGGRYVNPGPHRFGTFGLDNHFHDAIHNNPPEQGDENNKGRNGDQTFFEQSFFHFSSKTG